MSINPKREVFDGLARVGTALSSPIRKSSWMQGGDGRSRSVTACTPQGQACLASELRARVADAAASREAAQ